MKKMMYWLGVMMAVVLAGVNVFFVVQDGRSDSLEVKDAQASITRTSNAGCDPIKYQIGYREDWESREAIDGYVKVNGESSFIGNIVGGGEVKINVQVPVCSDSPQNCCDKKHLDKPFQVL